MTETKLKPGFIRTFSGRAIYPLNPDPADVALEDVAHHLSNLCRFTGAVRKFYSVAEHSVRVSEIVEPEYALEGLLHDASEAYLSDFASPIKQQAGFGDVYRATEAILMQAVGVAFGIPAEMSERVHWADKVLLRTEMRDLMPPGDMSSGREGEVLDNVIVPWTPEEAEVRFLDRYELLTKPPVEYLI